MKKTYLMVAIAISMGFAACGGKTGSNVSTEDSLTADTTAVVEEEPQVLNTLSEKLQSDDPAGAKQAIEESTKELEKLLADGDTLAAAKYANQVQQFVTDNADKLKSMNIETVTLGSLIQTVNNLPTSATNAVKSDAHAAKEAAKSTANQAVESAEDKVNQEVEDAQNKAVYKINESAQKASDATNKAIDDAAAKTKKKLGL